jgi:hypothetical protein
MTASLPRELWKKKNLTNKPDPSFRVLPENAYNSGGLPDGIFLST